MKVAVSADKKDLDAPINPRFGRCPLFIIVDTDDMSFEAVDNENIALSGGAGIQTAQFLASQGAEVVITGNAGPNAVRTLAAAGIEVLTDRTGTVRQAVDDFKKSGLKDSNDTTVPDRDTTGSQAGLGQGMGRQTGGRGMGGQGMGQGMGRGMGGKGMGRGLKNRGK